MTKFHQGFFKPKNPKKYAGDPKKIVFRSSWEFLVMDRFDRNPNIVEWASEEFFIRYFDPVTQKARRYFPDFIVKVKKDNKIVKQLVEIKPANQCFKPRKKKNTQSYINECKTYMTNMAKWSAAKNFCKTKNMEFIIVSRNPVNSEFIILTEAEVGF